MLATVQSSSLQEQIPACSAHMATQLRLTCVSCCYLGSSPSWRDMHSGAIHVVRIRGGGREADAPPSSGV